MKLTPEAAILTNACPGPGTGRGTSTNSIFSGPPVSPTWMAFIGNLCAMRGEYERLMHRVTDTTM